MEELLARLAPANHALAVEIARLPEQIRGYGHVKARNLAAVRPQWERLLQQWRGGARRGSGRGRLRLRGPPAAGGAAAYNPSSSRGTRAGRARPRPRAFVFPSRRSGPGDTVFISSAFAQAAPAAATGGDMQSSFMSMLPLVLMFVVLYFVMIRPQMKRQKEHRAMIEALAKGDEVATAGGLLGTVTKLGDTYLGVEVAPGVEVQVQRTAVVQVLPKGSIK